LLTKKEGRRRWRETKKNKGNTKEEKQEETSSWQREKQFAPRNIPQKEPGANERKREQRVHHPPIQMNMLHSFSGGSAANAAGDASSGE